MDIVVLSGGLSTERDVSLASGKNIYRALKKKGHRVLLVDVFLGFGRPGEDLKDIFDRAEEFGDTPGNIPEEAPDLEAVKALRQDDPNVFFGPNVLEVCRIADIVFLALHGEQGENGKVQAALDLFGVRYTGSGCMSSAIAMDKGISKQLFFANGIPTPGGISLGKEQKNIAFADTGLCLPCVVKPCSGGSSIGVSIVRDEGEFQQALDDAFCWEDQVIVEDYIKGREFSVGVIEYEALPVIEIAPIEGFYDYKNKYKAGSAVETCPAELPQNITEQMQKYAVEVAKAFGFSTYARMDFLLNENQEMFCLEANTLPGMTSTSLLPQEAQVIGLSYEDLCEKIVQISMKKYQER